MMKHRLRRFGGVVLVAALFAVTVEPSVAYADDEQSYAAAAVQNRRYGGMHEFTLYGGILPLDAFTKGFTLSGSYTLHISNIFAWEAVNFLKSFGVDTNLRDQLEQLELGPTPFEILDWSVTTNLVLKPIYWKGAWFNQSIIHGEIMVLVGGGFTHFSRSNRGLVDVGLALRVFLSEVFSVRVDVRHNFVFQGIPFVDGVDNELWIGLGVSLSVG